MASPGEHERKFIEHLQRIVDRDDRAALAALRRAATSPETATVAHRYVVPWLSKEPSPWRDDCHYLVAGLFAGYPKAWPPGEERFTNLGASFVRLAQATGNAASVESRFTTLLAASTDELPVRLRNAVSLLKAKDVPVDWSRLLYDLTRWRSESRWVQRRWARSFWSSQDSEHVEQLSKENSNVS